MKGYPTHAYKTKREWLKTARKQWSAFRKLRNESEVMVGSAYYPKEVYEWLSQFEEMDKKMKSFYQNA